MEKIVKNNEKKYNEVLFSLISLNNPRQTKGNKITSLIHMGCQQYATIYPDNAYVIEKTKDCQFSPKKYDKHIYVVRPHNPKCRIYIRVNAIGYDVMSKKQVKRSKGFPA